MTSIWPYMPQVQPVESLEWETDIQTCFSAEYRHAMRPYPRQEWLLDYKPDQVTFSQMREEAKKLGDEEFWLPMWPEQTYVGSISASTTTLPVDSTHKSYSTAGSLLIWDGASDYEVRPILSFGAGTIELESGVSANYTEAYVMPLRLVTFEQYADAQPLSVGVDLAGHVASVSARFRATVTEDLSGESPAYAYTTYLTIPVFTNPVIGVGDSGQTFGHDVDVLDSGTGLVSKVAGVSKPVQRWSIAWHVQDADSLWELRLWLHKRHGRQKCFWLPSRINDITLADDIAISDPTIEVVDVDFDVHHTLPVDLGLWDAGVFRGLRISGASSGSGGVQTLTLSSPSTVDVDMADVTLASKLTLCRLDSDRVEIQHEFGGGAMVTVPVVEVPEVPSA